MYINKRCVFLVKIISWEMLVQLGRADLYCSLGTLMLLPTKEEAYRPQAVLGRMIVWKKKRPPRNVRILLDHPIAFNGSKYRLVCSQLSYYGEYIILSPTTTQRICHT